MSAHDCVALESVGHKSATRWRGSKAHCMTFGKTTTHHFEAALDWYVVFSVVCFRLCVVLEWCVFALCDTGLVCYGVLCYVVVFLWCVCCGMLRFLSGLLRFFCGMFAVLRKWHWSGICAVCVCGVNTRTTHATTNK